MLTSGPMGAALWIATGVAACLIARTVPVGRRRSFALELVVAVVTAATLGVLATALDFGGWNEPDWRAGLFAFLGAAAAAGALRSLGA